MLLDLRSLVETAAADLVVSPAGIARDEATATSTAVAVTGSAVLDESAGSPAETVAAQTAGIIASDAGSSSESLVLSPYAASPLDDAVGVVAQGVSGASIEATAASGASAVNAQAQTSGIASTADTTATLATGATATGSLVEDSGAATAVASAAAAGIELVASGVEIVQVVAQLGPPEVEGGAGSAVFVAQGDPVIVSPVGIGIGLDDSAVAGAVAAAIAFQTSDARLEDIVGAATAPPDEIVFSGDGILPRPHVVRRNETTARVAPATSRIILGTPTTGSVKRRKPRPVVVATVVEAVKPRAKRKRHTYSLAQSSKTLLLLGTTTTSSEVETAPPIVRATLGVAAVESESASAAVALSASVGVAQASSEATASPPLIPKCDPPRDAARVVRLCDRLDARRADLAARTRHRRAA